MTSYNVPTTVAAPHEVAARDREVIARVDKVPVKFVDDGRGFVAGEVAGFPRAEAQHLVDQGVASFDLRAALKVAAPPEAIMKQNHALTAAAAGDVGVKFLCAWEAYIEGDCVGLSEGLARRLIAGGVAVSHVPAAAPRRTLADIRAALKGR